MKEEILQINEENLRQINERIENIHVTINQKVDKNNEERKQEIAETNEKLEKTNETVMQVREEIQNKINDIQNENKTMVEGLQQETVERCEKIKQEVHQIREENKEGITQVQTDMGERLERVYDNLNNVESQIDTNKSKIEEIRRREIQTQEEVDSWRDRTCQHNHIINNDNRESINFRSYKRNPMEFLKRLEEMITRNRENRWNIIRGMIDEMFKDTYNNWWTAVRPNIQDITEFKKQFREKYWSESTQNMVRNNLSNGRYKANVGQSPTSVSYTHLDVYKRQPYGVFEKVRRNDNTE